MGTLHCRALVQAPCPVQLAKAQGPRPIQGNRTCSKMWILRSGASISSANRLGTLLANHLDERSTTMKQGMDIDWQVRRLMKALEPTLRHHLGAEGVERQFVTGLYWRLRHSLEDAGGLPLESGEQGVSNLQRLALDVYLTAATHLEGRRTTPALLSSVRKEIERVLADQSHRVE